MLDSRETVTCKPDRVTSPHSSCEHSGKGEVLQGKFSIERGPYAGKGASCQGNHPESPIPKGIVTGIWCVVYDPLAHLWPCHNFLRFNGSGKV